MKKVIDLVMALLLVLLLAGCCAHDWQAASCTEAKTCAKCGETEGEALGHDWQEATCADPKTCARCGKTWGEVLDHEAGEWQIEEEADFRSAGLRVRSCIYCGEWMEEEEYHRPVYEDGVFTVSADEFARLVELEGDDMVTAAAAVDADGAPYVLLKTEGEEAAGVYFLDEMGETLAAGNTEDALNAATVVISAVGEEADVRNPALRAAVLACQNGEDWADADGRLEDMEYAFATGDLYRRNGAAYFWGSYGDGSALYISAGEVEALYDERAIIPYFDFTFEEFVEMFNAAPEDVNGGWSIERSDSFYAVYNINGTLVGSVCGLDYTQKSFAVEDATMAREQFNEIVFIFAAITGDEESDLLAAMVGGCTMSKTLDEDFVFGFFSDDCVSGTVERGPWRGQPALVYDTDGQRCLIIKNGDYYYYITQKLQG